MKRRGILTILTMTTVTAVATAAVASGPVFEDDFESGLDRWSINKNAPVETRISPAAWQGQGALEIRFEPVGNIERKWATVMTSKPVPATMGSYRLRAKIQLPLNYGCSVSAVFTDVNGKVLSANSIHYGSKMASPEEWYDHIVKAPAYHADTRFVHVKVSMPLWTAQIIRLDDVCIERLPDTPEGPPWQPQYKIKPHETDRLTAADFVMPDGIVYPDFSYAGAREEKLTAARRHEVKLSDFGAVADSDTDCSAALEQAIAALPAEGGTVRFDAGRYRLSRLLFIRRGNVVLRGAGREHTRIDLDYDAGENRVDLYGLRDGDRISPEETIHIYARPQQLVTLRLELDGKEFRQYTKGMHSGNQSFITGKLPEKVTPGPHKLTGIAIYSDKSEYRREIEVTVDPAQPPVLPPWTPSGYINFRGEGYTGAEFPLAEDGRRGSHSIRLQSADHPFQVGDFICLTGPVTPRWRELTRNACTWGSFRVVILEIAAVAGNEITFTQPLRIDYPAVDGSHLRKAELISGNVVADMTLEMKTEYWLTAVELRHTADTRVQNVNVIKCGRNPVYAYHSKFCTIRDCDFDDGWYKGGGGTSYTGWEACYDSLMENVTTRRLRHAPLVQWSASGNVIRNSTFYNSDAHWHAGWTHENLFENCRILSDTDEHGGAGYGLLASQPEDGAHGPNGPRNVVYGCDVYSRKASVWLGGMNENWIFAYNRFHAETEGGFFLKTTGFDHIIAGNVFQLKSKSDPLITFGSNDCGGVEITGNLIFGGNGRLYQGLSVPGADQNNRFFPYRKDAPLPRPAIPSLYEYQQEQRGKPGA